jgi:hypothetical protein
VEVNAAAYLEFPKDTVTRKPTTGIAGRACNMGPDSRYAVSVVFRPRLIRQKFHPIRGYSPVVLGLRQGQGDQISLRSLAIFLNGSLSVFALRRTAKVVRCSHSGRALGALYPVPESKAVVAFQSRACATRTKSLAFVCGRGSIATMSLSIRLLSSRSRGIKAATARNTSPPPGLLFTTRQASHAKS